MRKHTNLLIKVNNFCQLQVVTPKSLKPLIEAFQFLWYNVDWRNCDLEFHHKKNCL